jgi:hypothetical protein
MTRQTWKSSRTLANDLVTAFCMPPTGELSPEQVYALQVFKHEVIAALFRLYMVVPKHITDEMVKPYLKAPTRRRLGGRARARADAG